MVHNLIRQPGATTKFLLGLAGVLALLLLVGALWWLLPIQPRSRWDTSDGDIQQIRIADDGKTLLTVHENGLRLWDLVSLRQRASLKFDERGLGAKLAWNRDDVTHSKDVSFSPDGQMAAYSNARFGIELWNPQVQAKPFKLNSLAGHSWFAADSQTLFTTADSFSGEIPWDVTTGRQRDIPKKDNEGLLADKAGRLRTIHNVSGDNPALKFSDPFGKEKPVVLEGAQLPFFLSPDGNHVAAMCGTELKLWEMKTGRAMCSLAGQVDLKDGGHHPYFHAVFATHGPKVHVISGAVDGKEHSAIWDFATDPPRKLMEPSERWWGLLSPDGQWLIHDNKVWNLETLRTEYELEIPIDRLTFAPDSQSYAGILPAVFRPQSWLQGLLGRKPAPALTVCEVSTGRQILSIDHGGPFEYSSDGKSLAIALPGGTVEIWDIPPPSRRSLFVEYGLPILFGSLLLLAIAHCLRFRRRITAEEASPC
jgi:WD40 repeat protein